MPTLIKKVKQNRPHSVVGMEEVTRLIREGEWRESVNQLREKFPVLQTQKMVRDESLGPYTDTIPEACFGAEFRMQNGAEVMMKAERLVTLTANYLPSTEEAVRLRDEAALVPYTRMAYVGANGCSVVIVAAYRLAEGEDPGQMKEMQKLQQSAFARLHYLYSSQLGLCLDNTEPKLDLKVLLSYDPNAYYNGDSEQMVVRKNMTNLPEYPTSDAEFQNPQKLSGYSEMEQMSLSYEWCVRHAIEEARQSVNRPEDVYPKALSLLADYCSESGLPIEFAILRTSWKRCFQASEDHLRVLFETAYESQSNAKIPLGHIEKSALLMMRTEAFLRTHYELRRNVMTGVVQYRQCDGYHYEWRDLTEAAMNSMTSRALKVGLCSWDKDIRRLVNSEDVERYEPLSDWLMKLPRWNGRDQVASLVARIPTDTPRVQEFMHIWLRSMVAHWLGRDSKRGNSLVPLLIGSQGCGKTTLCTMILPPELMDYYNDRVDFRNDTALALGLSTFALINIDEFDSLKRSQQPTLKYLLSKGDVKLRPPYGKSFVSRRRFASFIGTTNNRHPLTDPSGSRRFLCIEVREGEQIDFLSPIDYEQLYAQLVHEVMFGERYWLTDEETAELMQQNLPYQQPRDLADLLDVVLTKPEGEEGELMSMVEIIDLLKERFPETNFTNQTNENVGKVLKARGFERHRCSMGVKYRVAMSSELGVLA